MLTTLAMIGILACSTEPPISVRDIERNLRVLTSPALEGRLTLARGSIKAAEYIAGEFKKARLQPLEKGSFFNEFDVTVNQRPTKNNFVLIEREGKRLSLKLGSDYVPLPGSAPMKLVQADLAFVGFGIKNDTRNDFAGIDLNGKIAVMLRGAPAGVQPTSNGSRAKTAKELGAVGVVFCGPSAPGRAELPRLTRGQGVPAGLGIVAIGIHRRIFRELSGIDYEQAIKGDEKARVAPMASAKILTELEPNKGVARNVVGVIPGNDPRLKDEFIIIGGHYDHLGYGEVSSLSGSDLIHFGADDNASGTSGVLALARYFAQAKINRRTLIFQAYSGEEIGLVGSAAWASTHPDILKRTTLMVNMDMIGRLRKGKVIVTGTGTAAELDGILKKVSEPGLSISATANAPGNSDHASFMRMYVPVLFWFTDMHPEYHTEKDTFETLNIPGIATVLAGVKDTIKLVDQIDGKLAYVGTAPKGPGGAGDPGRTRRVRVGFIPDMSDSGPGLLLNGASPESPAAKAGVQMGDRLIEFDGKRIDGIEDLQTALVNAKAGVTIKIAVVRNGQRIELELTPVEASGG